MSNLLKEKKFNEDYLIRVKYLEDTEGFNPRELDDNLGILAIDLKRYDLNEFELYKSGMIREISNSHYEALVNSLKYDKGLEDVTDEEILKDIIYLPVYVYIHGGITISTTPFSCSWDSGQAGWIFTTINKAKKYIGDDLSNEELIEKAKIWLKEEIEIFDKYLTDEIYEISLIKKEKCSCCNNIKEELIESNVILGYENIEPEIKIMESYCLKEN